MQTFPAAQQLLDLGFFLRLCIKDYALRLSTVPIELHQANPKCFPSFTWECILRLCAAESGFPAAPRSFLNRLILRGHFSRGKEGGSPRKSTVGESAHTVSARSIRVPDNLIHRQALFCKTLLSELLERYFALPPSKPFPSRGVLPFLL